MKKDSHDFDIILDVLKQALVVYPGSVFINSLYQQYQERGSLSKKQLEGLHSKASKIKTISPGKLATIQAIILKKHSKHRSIVTKQPIIEPADTVSLQLMGDILARYPGHKRVLFLKAKYDKRDPLSAIEKAELEKFHKLLLKPGL